MAAEHIAVVGAGTMGAAIAGVFAQRGFRVSIYSRGSATLDAARNIVSALASVNASLTYTTSLDACVADADIVSENVSEDLTLKRRLFASVERAAPADCLLTTNTSSVPIGAIAENLEQPGRLVGVHWFNPPAVMPLVEIVRSQHTADQVVTRARALAAAIGKQTIEVNHDVPGFVVNRLQYALLREALHLVETGVTSIADVDRAVETTLAPRWSALGPLRLMDLAGLDTVAKVSAILMPALGRAEGISPLISRLVAEGALGSKTGRGFYAWAPGTIDAARQDRDDTVRLLNARHAI